MGRGNSTWKGCLVWPAKALFLAVDAAMHRCLTGPFVWTNSMKIKLTDPMQRHCSIVALILCATLLTAPGISRADTIYVSNSGYSVIARVDSGTGASLGFLQASGLGQPEGLAFDSAGNLYIADSYYYSVVKITPGGTSSLFANFGSAGVNEPMGLVIDKQDNVYVANYGNNTIIKITPGGVGSVFATSSSGVNLPRGLALDRAGNLYVANVGGGNIEKFTPDGVGSVFASSGGFGLAFDQTGNLYVSEQYGTIERFSPTGTDLGAFVTLDNTALGLAFDSQDNLYAVNYWDNAINKITPQGISSLFIGGLNEPTFIAIVPEPSILALLNLGLAAMLVSRRRTG